MSELNDETINQLVELLKKKLGPEKPLSKKEAADHIGIHYRTLEKALETGAITSHIVPGTAKRVLFASEINFDLKKRKNK